MPLSLRTLQRCDAQPIHRANWHSPITDLHILHGKSIRRPTPRRSVWTDLIFTIAGPINKFFWSRILHFSHHFRHLRFKNLLSSLRANCECSHNSHYVVCIFKKHTCVCVCHGTVSGRGQFIYWRCTSIPPFGSERSTGRNKWIWQLPTLQTQTEILAYIAVCRGSQRLTGKIHHWSLSELFLLKEIWIRRRF